MVNHFKGFTRVKIKKVQINSGTMFNMAANKTSAYTALIKATFVLKSKLIIMQHSHHTTQ